MRPPGRIAIAGGSGFAGRALTRELLSRGHAVRILARSVGESGEGSQLETRPCDVFSLKQVEKGLQGCATAVYLIHSMLPNNRLTQGTFQDLDLIVADNFARACRDAGVKRIVYLGGLVPDGDLSVHLKSRLEVEHTLAGYGTELFALRAGLVIGAGGSSYQVLSRLVKRLPVMVCPAWTHSRSQPVSVENAVAALVACCEKETAVLPVSQEGRAGASSYRILNIGSVEALSYNRLMQEAAKVYGRSLLILTVPVNSYALSKLWVRIFSGAARTLIDPLVESLKHDMLASSNVLPDLIGRAPDTVAEMLRKAESEKPANDNFPASRSSSPRNVRSVQRLEVLPGMDAHWLAVRYGRWVEAYLKGLIRVIRNGRDLVFQAQGVELLRLEYSSERSDRTRALYYIAGGALVRSVNSGGRLEFRTLPAAGQAIAAVHDFEPALPWPVYSHTQAPVHEFVMTRFQEYLKACSIRKRARLRQ